MKRNLVTILTVAALAAGMAVAQTAATPANPGIGVRAAVRQRILKKLNLTDAQKAQAKEITQQAKTAAQPLRQQLQQNRQSLAAAVQSNDTAQIQSLAAAQGALRGQVLAIRSGAQAKFFAILTPDQKTQWSKLVANWKARMTQRAEGPKGQPDPANR